MEKVHLRFEIYDREHNIIFTNHLAIHVLQLKKVKKDVILKTDKDRWLYLFKYGGNLDLDCLPKSLDTHIFKKVVNTMRTFTYEEQERDLYERRQLAEGEYRGLRNLLQEERKQRQLERQQRQWERQQRLTAQKAFQLKQKQLHSALEVAQQQHLAANSAFEQERQERLALEALLRKAGINPDHV